MSGWGWFILIVILLVPAAYFGFIFYKRQQASKAGLPPPPFNPFTRFFSSSDNQHGGSQIYPAPSSLIDWVKNKYYGLRNSRTKTGAYEQTSDHSHRGAGDGYRTSGGGEDEAWDARVDGYGPGGYYEEQELGLRPPPASGHAGAAGGPGSGDYYSQGGDVERGRSLSRAGDVDEEDTAYRGGGRSRQRDNPFGDAAEASSMRTVSPLPGHGQGQGQGQGHAQGYGHGHRKQDSEGSALKVELGDSPTERRSMFREGV